MSLSPIHIHRYLKADMTDFEKEIRLIVEAFREISPLHLRHKTVAHIVDSFTHVDFVSAYIVPELAKVYGGVAKQLKSVFFEFCGYANIDDPFAKIKQQSQLLTETIK